MIRSRIRRSRTLSVRPRPYRSKLSATRISAGCMRFLILSQTLERLTRAMLFREIWNYKFTPKSNLVDVHMGRLRRKIDQADEWPMICTIRGHGFVLRAPQAAATAMPNP